MNALESTLNELSTSKIEIEQSILEVAESICELEDSINHVYQEQSEKVSPDLMNLVNQNCSKQEIENDMQIIQNKIHQLEEEIKCKHFITFP